jgi:hypothetical protein
MDTPNSTLEPMNAGQHEVITALVETIHSAQEANARGYKSSTLFNES